MKDYQLTSQNLPEFIKELQQELSHTPHLVIKTSNANVGKWGMARLWRAWMTTTAEWMAAQGAIMPLCVRSDGRWYGSRPFSENDAHDLFTHQWLGVDSDGNRLSWSKSGRDGMRAATKGERFLAMQYHEGWASERGILLVIPRDSEYQELKDAHG